MRSPTSSGDGSAPVERPGPDTGSWVRYRIRTSTGRRKTQLRPVPSAPGARIRTVPFRPRISSRTRRAAGTIRKRPRPIIPTRAVGPAGGRPRPAHGGRPRWNSTDHTPLTRGGILPHAVPTARVDSRLPEFFAAAPSGILPVEDFAHARCRRSVAPGPARCRLRNRPPAACFASRRHPGGSSNRDPPLSRTKALSGTSASSGRTPVQPVRFAGNAA